MKKITRIVTAILVLSFVLTGAASASAAVWLNQAEQALGQTYKKIGCAQGDENLLVLTNAGYGQVADKTTETFIDSIQKITGCSQGTRSLLLVHSSIMDPLWFSLYHRASNKLIFVKYISGEFQTQELDASPNKILTPDGWRKSASGLIGPNAFGVISISLTWTSAPPWPLLQAASFHDHFCPGVNSGYIIGEYLKKNLPLGPGDKYVFATAPAKCAADALQVMFNTTSGKSSGYSMNASGPAMAGYTVDGVSPTTAAMRVNQKKDICTGLVLGFDWNGAFEATGVSSDELSPKGGRNNPMFWIARVKMSRELARLPLAKLVSLIKELKSFSGPASLAGQVGGGDPYAVVWTK